MREPAKNRGERAKSAASSAGSDLQGIDGVRAIGTPRIEIPGSDDVSIRDLRLDLDTKPQESLERDDNWNSCVVVVNKESGTVTDLWDDDFERSLLKSLEASGWQPELKLVRGNEIESTVRSAKERKVGAVIAGGGDGTTSSVAKLMLGCDIPLGILPFGTLNLAARDLGSPLEPLEAVAALVPGKTRSIDALELGDRLCLCMVILGVYPELLKRSEEFHGRNWWRKFTGMGTDFVRAFLASPKMNLSICMDGDGAQRVRTRMLMIVPGQFQDDYGMIPKREHMDGGQCTLFVSKHRSAWSLFRMIGNFLLGRSVSDPDLEINEASSIEIQTTGRKSLLLAIDGELTRFDLPLRFDLKKKALLVLDPSPIDKP